MEKIVVNKDSRNALISKYGAPNVSKALLFRSNSPMAKEIRHMAMNEYNGVILT